MIRVFVIVSFVLLATLPVQGQCFASAGNPMGGGANLGVMQQGTLRTMAFYRHHAGSQYYQGNEKYNGISRLYQRASYNYLGSLLAYGITDRLTAELETGYFLDKTLEYRLGGITQQGYGLSNAVTSMKYAIYSNQEKRFEVSAAAGISIPFRNEYMRVNGVELPEDAQPTIAAYGLVLQSFVVKENSFTAMRYFWINRFETYSVNPKGEIFGNAWQSAAFISRHFIFGDGLFKDWTAILQLRYQHHGQTLHEETQKITESSGGRQLLVAPQINVSINQQWNLSVLFEKPLYQYQNGIQLGVDYAVLVNLARDFNIRNKE